MIISVIWMLAWENMVPQTILTRLVTRENLCSRGDKWSGNMKNAKQAFPQCAGDGAQGSITACLSASPSSIHPPNLHPWLLRCPFVDIIHPVMFLLLAALSFLMLLGGGGTRRRHVWNFHVGIPSYHFPWNLDIFPKFWELSKRGKVL